jgi:hypothetical protein
MGKTYIQDTGAIAATYRADPKDVGTVHWLKD